jgi:hypothetical protein
MNPVPYIIKALKWILSLGSPSTLRDQNAFLSSQLDAAKSANAELKAEFDVCKASLAKAHAQINTLKIEIDALKKPTGAFTSEDIKAMRGPHSEPYERPDMRL